MKKFMLVIFDRFNVSQSQVILFESDLSNLKDVLINKLCEIWEIDVEEFKYEVKEDRFIGIDLEEEGYLLIDL